MIYNHALINARASNYREAITLLQEAFTQAFESSGIRNYIHQIRGFIYLYLGLKNSDNFDLTNAEFNQIENNSKIAMDYQQKLQLCLSNISATSPETASTTSTCVANLVSEIARQDENTVFPIFPVYACKDNPALAIAEQVLEPASTRLCR